MNPYLLEKQKKDTSCNKGHVWYVTKSRVANVHGKSKVWFWCNSCKDDFLATEKKTKCPYCESTDIVQKDKTAK